VSARLITSEPALAIAAAMRSTSASGTIPWMVQPNAVESEVSTLMSGKRSLRRAMIALTSAMISAWFLRILAIECGSLTDTGMVMTWVPASNAMVA
jgi:hypothetical protein